MSEKAAKDRPTVEQFLSEFPEPIRDLSNRLRSLVRETVPDVTEVVYPGWRLIGYRVPEGKKTYYMGFICPYPDRVMLGFEQGRMLSDPNGLLQGDALKQVRYVDVRRPEDIQDDAFRSLIFEAAMRSGHRAWRKEGRA